MSKMDALSLNLPSVNEISERLPKNCVIKSIKLSSFLGQTLFAIQCSDSLYIIPADSTEKIPAIDEGRIQSIQKIWCSSPITRIDSMYTLDQWIPFGRLKSDYPIYKYHFDDKEKHELYISSQTGEVLQFTDSDLRFWGWLGAVPHWVYYTLLRQYRDLWWWVVVLSAGIGCFMSLGGIYLGIEYYRINKRKTGKLVSPYKKKIYKWHHVTGTIFGIFTITFAFSGMMSMTPVPQWISKTHSQLNVDKAIKGDSIPLSGYQLDYRNVIEQTSRDIKQIEWHSFHNLPLYRVITTDSTYTLDASEPVVRPLKLTEEFIRHTLHELYGEGTGFDISLMTEYDNYYLSKKNPLPLPVYKAILRNEDNSCFYINPETAEYKYIDNNRRWKKWMYSGLHSYSIKWLLERPVLWNIVMWTTMLGGTVVSFTGVWLAIKYIIRLFFRSKKKRTITKRTRMKKQN